VRRVQVFITGGTGFVGRHVVLAMQARGHEATCLVRDLEKAAALFGEAAPALVRGDLADAGVLARTVVGSDAVVHLAGLTTARSRAELFAVNADGTRTLAAAVATTARSVRRFVHVSSLAAAGPVVDGVIPSGSEASHPVSDYGRSKLAGEASVRALGCAWTILRPPAVYGPGDRAFLPLFRIVRRGFAPTFGDGAQRLSLVFVADLAAAIVACLEADVPPGVYYPAEREPTTARGLVERIGIALATRVRIVALPRPIVRPLFWVTGTAAKLAGRSTLLSPDKANEILADAWLCSPAALESATGWRATTDLASGLHATAEWYRDAGWL
jgi:nucleoside-diphosphate-sugar epimerase